MTEAAGSTNLSKLIRGMLHGVSPADPAVYAMVALLVGVVSLGAAYAPAWRERL